MPEFRPGKQFVVGAVAGLVIAGVGVGLGVALTSSTGSAQTVYSTGSTGPRGQWGHKACGGSPGRPDRKEGPVGATGPAGAPGPKGATGPQGPAGAAGSGGSQSALTTSVVQGTAVASTADPGHGHHGVGHGHLPDRADPPRRGNPGGKPARPCGRGDHDDDPGRQFVDHSERGGPALVGAVDGQNLEGRRCRDRPVGSGSDHVRPGIRRVWHAVGVTDPDRRDADRVGRRL